MNEILTQRLQAALRLGRNRWFQAALGLAVSTGFALLTARSVALHDPLGTLRDFSPAIALVAAAPLAASILLRALRWRALLAGEPAQVGAILLAQNTGIGLNNILPVRMVSEPVQLALITKRYGVPFPTAFTTLVTGNVLDIVATALLMGLGVALAPTLRDGRISIQLFGAVVLFIVSALVFVAVARGIQSIPLAGRFRFFEQVVAALGVMRERPYLLWAAFGATLAHWLALGLAGWLVAGSLGVDLHPIAMVAVLVAAAFFTSAMPSAPGGVGTYHFAVVAMLTDLGADPAAAFSFAVVIHFMVMLPSSAIALLMAGRVGFQVLLRSADANSASEPRRSQMTATNEAREA